MRKLLLVLLAAIMLASSVGMVSAAERTKDGIMYTEGLPIVDEGAYTFTFLVRLSENSEQHGIR